MIDLGFIRVYYRRDDWCGIGTPHRMVAWNWFGVPRSVVF
jgi:hypothetical protein